MTIVGKEVGKHPRTVSVVDAPETGVRPASVVPLILCLVSAPTFAAEPQPQVPGVSDEERVPLHTVVPDYPASAKRDRVEGEVEVCFNINAEGRPYRIAVRRSTHRIFEKPSMRAVRASSYRPLPRGQRPSGIKNCRTFRFRLDPVSG